MIRIMKLEDNMTASGIASKSKHSCLDVDTIFSGLRVG